MAGRRHHENCTTQLIRLREITMAKVLVVTSGKGGVGQTTSTAALGAALAQLGEKVVVVDFDVRLRNLDLVMEAGRRQLVQPEPPAPGQGQTPPRLVPDQLDRNMRLG